MSEPPKFNFGAPATSGGSGSSLFGSTNKTPSSIFGSIPNNTSSSSGGIFGNAGVTTSDSQNPSIFGASTGQNNSTIGGAGSGNSSTGNLFGGGNNTGSTGFSFSKGPEQNNTQGSNANPFGSNFLTPNKTSAPSSQGQTTTAGTPSIFGSGSGGNFGGSSASGGMFGDMGESTKSTSAPFGSTTPAPSQPGGGINFGNPSTTPAGPPPLGGSAGGNSGGFFGSQPAQQTESIFGQSGAKSTSQDAPATTAPSNIFGPQQQPSGGLFSATKPPSDPATTTRFGGNSGQTGGGLFGSNQGAPQPSTGGLFSNLDKGKQPETSTSATPSSTDTSLPQVPPPAAPASAAPKTTSFSFPPLNLSTTSSQQLSAPASTSGTTQSTGMFQNIGQSSAPASAPAAAPTGGMFASLQKPAASSAAPATSTSATSQTTSAAGGSIFGLGQSTTSPSTSQPATSASTAPAPGATLGGSTTQEPKATDGKLPSPQSRLKNKTMDEIVTHWASDLSKYQKEFQVQAEQVAAWDHMLVENGDKIQKLYGKTFEAEKQTAEVERQLAAVESQQEDLNAMLDLYERKVDDMMQHQQLSQSDALQGPDQERERTYKLAEQLSEQLDGMGQDLSSMISDINDASATLSKTNKSDEPISQIVRILNGHLSQLQVINEGTVALQTKVTQAQEARQKIGLSNRLLAKDHNADDFYKSYMGRR